MPNNAIRYLNAVHADRVARCLAEACRARIAPRSPRAGEHRLRRAVGRSIVRLGARIAAEPAIEHGLAAASRGPGGPAIANLDGGTLL